MLSESSVSHPTVFKSAHPSLTRRTLAIISHPDAGKTTLTEKFLLYGGAIDLAGSVTARRNQRSTTSDWMDLEKQRGISISSTVLQFEYAGFRVNLLDTPGHQDFSEDTYRVLTAVDAVIMVIDAGKGVESRTRKLFEICRLRGIPIFTFINKMDRPSRPPVELIDEVENVLGIASYPMNWPLGDGPRFRGLIDRRDGQLHLFERTPHGAYRAPEKVVDIRDPRVRALVDDAIVDQVELDLELIDGAGAAFDQDRVNAGGITPVFFGSAANNFGIQLLLDGFLAMAPAPKGRHSGDSMVSPQDPEFSAFVFKIQANMNPKHRDRMAFMRVVSGHFERDMTVTHSGHEKPVRLSNSQSLFARERETVEEAWAGDVVGIVGNHPYKIGDTLSANPSIRFREIPVFPPECFARIRAKSTAQAKRFRAGLEQFASEGVVQVYSLPMGHGAQPLLGAIGPLQFEVLKHRLENEYGADVVIEPCPYNIVRWIKMDGAFLNTPEPPPGDIPSNSTLARDPSGFWTFLAEGEWVLRALVRYQPDWELSENVPLLT
ncbi:MAG: peptide chain release factor 3 [Akkermansiaceae bacterium]